MGTFRALVRARATKTSIIFTFYYHDFSRRTHGRRQSKVRQNRPFNRGKLFSARKVLICEEINQTMAKRVMGQLLALAEDSADPIQLFVNSQGGHVEAGDSIHDMIAFIEPRVQVIGTGYVASAGTHIFLAAEKEDRCCLPNTRFLIHQPSGGAGGSASDIAIQAEQIIKMRERLAQVISIRTGTDIDRVRHDIERDKWMDTDEAIDYGIVSRVIHNSTELT